jgi:hypothetical protein
LNGMAVLVMLSKFLNTIFGYHILL